MVFHFCRKRGCLKIFAIFCEYIFSGWFRAKGTKVGKKGFQASAGSAGATWHRMLGSRGRPPHHREEITNREGSPGVSPHHRKEMTIWRLPGVSPHQSSLLALSLGNTKYGPYPRWECHQGT